MTCPLLAVTAAAAGFTFVRLIAAGNVFAAEGKAETDDDDDGCTADRPLHFSACSLDICHTHTVTFNSKHSAHTRTHTHTQSFDQDYLGRPVPEETFTHSHPS